MAPDNILEEKEKGVTIPKPTSPSPYVIRSSKICPEYCLHFAVYLNMHHSPMVVAVSWTLNFLFSQVDSSLIVPSA